MNQVENIRNATASHISVSGTLENLLSQGFNERDGLCEEIDNSLDGGATKIRITLDSNHRLYIHADNGCGMSEEKLPDAFTLNNRSNSSEHKFGRFGIGGLQAKVCLTNLKGKTTTISKQADCDNISQLKVDWEKCVAINEYINKSTEASSKNEEMYKKYVTEPFGSNSGTVHIYECDPTVYETICKGLSSRKIDESYIYYLEVKYMRHLKNGKNIEIVIDNVSTTLHPIDPLQMDKIPDERKSRIPIDVFCNKQNRNEIFIRITDDWITNESSTRKPKSTFKSNVNESDLEIIDNCILECAYSDNWYSEQLELFENSSRPKYDSIMSRDKKGNLKFNQNAKSIMGGKLYERNGAVVSQFPAKKATSGDKANYKYKEFSRFRFIYTSKIDDLMKTQVNKSSLKEDLFHSRLKLAFDILEKKFQEKVKLLDVPDEPVGVSDTNEELKSPEQPHKAPENPQKKQDINNTTVIHNLIALKQILSETIKFNREISYQLVEALTEIVEPKDTATFKRQWLFVSNSVPNILIDALIDTYETKEYSNKIAGMSIIQNLIDHINSNK